MLYSGRDQAPRKADPARVRDEQRTFARRIDCDSQPRLAAPRGTPRGGSVRDGDPWEHSRRGYGR